MSSVVRLYRRFQRWTEALPRAQYAILMGIVVFVVWIGLGILIDELSPVVAVFGALGFTVAYYYLDPQ